MGMKVEKKPPDVRLQEQIPVRISKCNILQAKLSLCTILTTINNYNHEVKRENIGHTELLE